MEKQNEVKTICFESVDLFRELVNAKQLRNLRGVNSNPYPKYCYFATKGVMKIVSNFMVEHDMKCDRTADNPLVWDDFERNIINAENKLDTIVTRNLRVVKRILDEGYGSMLKRTCVDQYKKKVFVFYKNDRIAEIKREEDMKNQERYVQRQEKNDIPINIEENKKKADIEISKLIKKVMKGQK